MITAKAYQRAATYIIMIAIAILSVHYEKSMKEQVVQMEESASQLEDLRAESESIRSAATVLENESKSNEQSGKELEERAQMLQEHSDVDAASAKNDEATAAALEEQAKKEDSEAEAYKAKAAEDEDTYQADAENATEMAAAADRDKAIAEDPTSKCNFFSKMWGCRETEKKIASENAAEETAKAAEDLREAAAAKADEKLQLQNAAEMSSKATEDANSATELENKAQQEISQSDEEKNEAIQAESKAESFFLESEKEWKEAMEKEKIVDEKKTEANKLFRRSKQHKNAAFKHSIYGLASAMIVLIYFTLSLFLKFVLFQKSRELRRCREANEEVRLLQDELDSKSSFEHVLSSSDQANQSEDKHPSETDSLLKGNQSSREDGRTISSAQDGPSISSSYATDEMEVVIVRSDSFPTHSINPSIDSWLYTENEEFLSNGKCRKPLRILATCLPYLNVLFELLVASWMIVILTSCSTNFHDLAPPFMSTFGLTVVRFLPLLAGCFIIVLVFHQCLSRPAGHRIL